MPASRSRSPTRPGATFVVSGIAQDFRGANNYRPNVTCDPLASGAERTITNWFNRACVVAPTDPSQPFGNADRNSVARPDVLAVRSRGIQAVRAWRPGAVRVPLRSVQPAEPARTSARRTATAAPARSARSPRPTIRVSSSSGSSCCGRRSPSLLLLIALHGRRRRRAPPRPLIIAPPRRERASPRAHARERTVWRSRWARTSSSPISSRPRTAS